MAAIHLPEQMRGMTGTAVMGHGPLSPSTELIGGNGSNTVIRTAASEGVDHPWHPPACLRAVMPKASYSIPGRSS
jgi:hypothetical protein